ncbi:MAG: dethiobiotin synthase, partial [Thermoproteota archaeon]|nr:dethiobiotin synthase [Thermoproteota archaeon]
TDTDVGKTCVTAALITMIKKLEKNVGFMKPFATGHKQNSKFKSSDVESLASISQINDPEELLNPYFFSIPASPFTAAKKLNIDIKLSVIHSAYSKLVSMHDCMIVEGIGGVMTPIKSDYTVCNLIKELDLSTIIVCDSKIGTVNHTLMTCKMCELFKIPIIGIIINSVTKNGYDLIELKNNLEELTGLPVLGSVQHMDNFQLEKFIEIFSQNIELEKFL